ncbi:MAG: 1-deoxy-D-xylulose-5-phosphate synthase, partial [Phascolarctobacterium sp.]|nr:1-deoxy-D-xylulose-5-phosphate synthase [Phascolarctobacterium sp.]
VGIAEQHAVTAAAGMAAAGLNPVVAIYSTFMQRAYDSVMHDICMQNLHVSLCLDRAGLVGDDGFTHHGVFDYAYLRSMPNMTVMAPKDEDELRHMLKTAVGMNGPVAVRYPRGSGVGVALSDSLSTLPIGKAEVLREGNDVSLWAIGTMVESAMKLAEKLAEQGINAGVVNMRFAKPIDKELLLAHAEKYKNIVTLEEGCLRGGVGSAVLEALNEAHLLGTCKVLNFGIPDEFILHGDKQRLFQDIGLDVETMAGKVTAFVKGE